MSVIQNCGCDQDGRRLSWGTRVEEVNFEVFPKICNRRTIFLFGRGKSSKELGHSE